MAVVWGGGDGIRIACFVGQAVLDKVHARVVHARASDGSAPRSECRVPVPAIQLAYMSSGTGSSKHATRISPSGHAA